MDSDIFGLKLLSEEIRDDLQNRVDIILHKLKFFSDKPKVVLLQDVKDGPVHVSQKYAELIKIAGGFLIQGESITDVVAKGPDIIIIALKGKPLTDAMSQMQQFFLLPGWSEVSAVKENRVYLFDSVNYLEQEGEKAVESLEALAEIITPRYFNFGLEGKAWLKFSM